MRILYIDNDALLMCAAEKCFLDSGVFCVDVVFSSADALLKLQGNQYDAIISEYVPPVLDGIGVLKDLRLSGDVTPFIFFTGARGEDAAIEALNAGADFYLRKGTDPVVQLDDLVNTVRRIVARRRICCPPLPLQSEMRMILDSSDEPTVFIDPGRIILWANKIFFEFMGVDAWDGIGRHCYEVVWGRDTPCAQCRIPKVIASGRSVSSEVIRPDGRFYWVTTYPVTGSGDEKLGYVEKITDITAVKRSQEAVRQEKERYNLLFNSANDMIYLHELCTGGIPGKILDVNDAACRTMGYSREEFLQMLVCDLNDPDLNLHLASLLSDIGGKEQVVFEWQHVTKAGKIVPVEVSVVVFEMDGVPVALSVVRDITERWVTEQALRQREQEFRELVENINEVIFRFDRDGIITYVSPQIETMIGGFGFRPPDLVGRSFIEYVYPADRPGVLEHFQECLSGIKKQSTLRLQTEAGSVRWVLESSRPVREDGAVVGVQGMFLDITDFKLLSAALKKANKKLNILSSITRHDILNQLTSMNLYLDLIKGDSGDPQKLKEFFEAAGGITANVERIITFTRDYEDIGVKEPEWQDLGSVIDREMKSFSGLIVVNNDVCGLEIYADTMLGKVFSNLVGNAVMHGVTAQTVTISFEERADGGYIIVADDGVGIPEDLKESIFTKGVGKNTGFGLFLSREILDLAGISIRETGVPGVGARFEIFVPEWNYRHSPVA